MEEPKHHTYADAVIEAAQLKEKKPPIPRDLPIHVVGFGQVSALSGGAPMTDLTQLSPQASIHPGYEQVLADFRSTDSPFRDHDRSVLLALVAARQAVEAAGWQGQHFAILAGSSRGPTQTWEAAHQQYQTALPLRPHTSPLTTLGSVGFALADFFDQRGLASTQSVTCSSGLHALLHGVALIRAGMEEQVLLGGAEAPLTPFTIAQLRAMRLLATDGPSQPMGIASRGMRLGEGAAFCCLSPKGKGAAFPRILGIGAAQERPGSLSGISEEGDAFFQAMLLALEEAGQLPDLIIPHAPGTHRGDKAEQKAIGRLFGSSTPPIYTTKWLSGHTLGASGPLALDAALRLLHGLPCPPIPYELKSPFCAWDVRQRPQRVLLNASGFGGNAVSVLVGW